MRTKKVTRHYCDHCGKGGFRKPAMEVHELHCTMNPNRKCRMCDMAGLAPKPIADLIKMLPEGGSPGGPIGDDKEIREATKGCPACMLAAIRQSKDGFMLNFNFKGEAEAWVSNHTKYTGPMEV